MERGARAGLARKLLLVTLLAIAAYAVLMFVADVDSVQASLRKLPIERLAGAAGLASLSFVFRFARWQSYLSQLAIRVSAIDSALIFASGLGLSITPGKTGELIKAWMLRDVSGTPLAQSVPIILAERITDAIALLMLGAFGLLDTPVGLPILIGTALCVLGVTGALSSARIGAFVVGALQRIAFFRRHRDRLLAAHASIASLFVPKQLLIAGALSLSAWGVHGLALLLIANAFPTVSLSFAHAMVTNAAPLLAGALAMIPGGIGLTEASMTGALMAFGGVGTTKAMATAITIATRIATLWWAVAIGLGALALWQLAHVPDRNRVDDPTPRV